MKLLLETTGGFQLQDDTSRVLIRAVGLTVADKTSFVEWRAACGQIRIKAQLGDLATDEEWLAYLKASDGDETLAVASFLSAYPLDEKYTLPSDPDEAAVIKAKRVAAAAKRTPAPAPAPAPAPTPVKPV